MCSIALRWSASRRFVRAEAVTAFLAFLELIRLGVARAFQRSAFGEIHVTRTDVAFSAADVRDTYA